MNQLEIKFEDSIDTPDQTPKYTCSLENTHSEIDFYCPECLWPFYLIKED